MIYIDPPYNTGSDGFVYQDDRKFTVEQLENLAGLSEEKAQRILNFTQSSSNSHSAWLTFMYPRLYIAKRLMKDDGVIFVSIDDNEVAQLRLLMDDVFGEENFVGNIPTVMNLKGNQDNFGFADTHEYFLVYARDKSRAELFEYNINEEEILNDWQEDEYGLFKKADGLQRTGDDASRNNRPKGWFPVFITLDNDIYVTENNEPKSNKDITLYPINGDNEELSWSWGKKKIIEEGYNLIVTKARNGGKAIYKKQRPRLGELPSKKPKSFFYKPEYSTSTATTQLKKLFTKKIFKGPKPVPFVKDLLFVGITNNDIILDFFAGSGTTGDAVMQLNAEDGGTRKFILAQLPETIDPKKNKTAYDFVKDKLKVEKPTIFEITKERLIRAAKKIKEETIVSRIAAKEKEVAGFNSSLDL
jgi:adenine-specific DNA-methyltransferase